MSSLRPGWVEAYQLDADERHLVMTVFDPITKTDLDVRVSVPELEGMLRHLRRPQELTGTQAAAEHLSVFSSGGEYRGRHRR